MSTRPRPDWRRRVESQWLRWGARLESEWTDRYFPWIAGAVLFFLYLSWPKLGSEASTSAPTSRPPPQGAWLIAHGHTPDLTVTGIEPARPAPADRACTRSGGSLGYCRPFPTLLALQAAGLAFGVVPLWRIARRVADLRAGAALASDRRLRRVADDQQPQPRGLPPRPPWPSPRCSRRRTPPCGSSGAYFFLWSVATLIWSAELGLVIAGIGLLVAILGDRGAGTLIIIFGLAWAIIAVLVLEPRFGSTGFIAPGAFRAYGSNAFSIAGGMLIHPNKVLGDLLDEDNVRLIIGLLAPLLFLPVLAPRFLIPPWD